MFDNNTKLENELKAIIKRNLTKVMDYDPFRNFPGIYSTQDFMILLEGDPAFSPFYLNREKYVTARFGGNLITSLHRKIGDIYEEIIQTILSRKLDIPIEDLKHSLLISIAGEDQKRSTDGIILLNKLTNPKLYNAIKSYVTEDRYIGLGLEIRSCYQIGDSKRIQADRDMALALNRENIQPVMLILCKTSLTSPIRRLSRYWLLLEGMKAFEFVKKASDFDLYSFLEEQKDFIQPLINQIFGKF